MRDASADLTTFAQRWHTVIPDLSTDPGELADQVMWLHGRRVEDPINSFITRRVADAHPDGDRIREAEGHAYTALERAEQTLDQLDTALDTALEAELRPHGPAAPTADATGRLSTVTDELAGVERDLRTASARVEALANDVRIRTLPGGGLDGEHERWAADRLARQEAAARAAKERWLRQQRSRRIQPPRPGRSAPDRGWGISR